MKSFAVCLLGLFAFVCPDTQAEPQPTPEPVGNTPEIQCEHALFGCPSGTPETNDLVIRGFFTLSSSDETKFADWVAYRLDASMVDGPDVSRNLEAGPPLRRVPVLHSLADTASLETKAA